VFPWDAYRYNLNSSLLYILHIFQMDSKYCSGCIQKLLLSSIPRNASGKVLATCISCRVSTAKSNKKRKALQELDPNLPSKRRATGPKRAIPTPSVLKPRPNPPSILEPRPIAPGRLESRPIPHNILQSYNPPSVLEARPNPTGVPESGPIRPRALQCSQ
jgi:hypothetical protein